MKIFALVLLATIMGGAQDSQPVATKATLCDLYQHPEQYSGKIVEVRATVVGNDLWIDDFQQGAVCSSFTNVIAVYPNQVKPTPSFTFVQDESFSKFQEGLRAGMNVEATFEGRFDVAFIWQDHKVVRKGPDKGYGKKQDYGARIVLLRISDVLSRTRAPH